MRRLLSALALAVLVALTTAPLVAAHPLGNFSVNRYSRVEVGTNGVQLRYVLDLAEIPTLQELRAAGIEALDPNESTRQRLLDTRTKELVAGARLELNGQPVPWTVRDASLELLPGQADLRTMRVVLTLTAPPQGMDGARLVYRDTNYSGRVGWHEVVLRGDGTSLSGSSAPSEDQTAELTRYPDDPTRAPLDISSASATIRVDTAAALRPATYPSDPQVGGARFAVDSSVDRLTALLREAPADNLLSILVMLAVAAGLGAMHALGPGDGKTVVGAYLVGSRGTALHAVFLGLTVTLTHTVGVYALGLITLVAAQYIVPERLYPILGVVSGLLVVTIGLSLARTRLAHVLRRSDAFSDSDHHQHNPTHVHDTAHSHHHGANGHQHSHQQTVRPHRHGGVEHRHEVPGADGSPITLKSLLALGVSGGLLPCPSALVVLLAAIAFHNVALGMVLVAAFSVGLAGVLTSIGLLMVYGGRWIGQSRLAGRLTGTRFSSILPALSALAITVAGLVITLQAARTLL